MLRSKKEEFIVGLEELYKQSSSVIVTHYRGLTVSEVTSLRRNLRKDGAGFKVVKNTLSKIAASKAGLDPVANLLSGPTAIAYSKDPVAAARNVVEFAKTNQKLKIVGGIVNNQILNKDEIQHLAELPSLDELRGKIIGILQAPATKMARVIQAPAAQLARVLQAFADKN